MIREDEIREMKGRAFRASFRDDEKFRAEILALAAELAAETVLLAA